MSIQCHLVLFQDENIWISGAQFQMLSFGSYLDETYFLLFTQPSYTTKGAESSKMFPVFFSISDFIVLPFN